MILYHSTRVGYLPSIRAAGLVPYVPGAHHDDNDERLAHQTEGQAVVWLTSDRSEWNEPVLTVRLEANSKRLQKYWPWRLKQSNTDVVERAQLFVPASYWLRMHNWFVYFGTIAPNKITFPMEQTP